MKTRLLILVVISIAWCSAAFAHASLEQELAEARKELATFDGSLSLHERKMLKQTSEWDRDSLEPVLRVKWEERARLKDHVESHEKMAGLKRSLMELPGREDYASGAALEKRAADAEAVARAAIPAFGELRKHYEMIRPAVLHNFFVNIGVKDQGFCWHWARDLTNRLKVLNLQTYDLLWATARGGTVREHNTVVLVSKGHALEDGLVLDGWKYSGKPFWIRVTDDKKHPWKVGQYYGGGSETEP